MPATTTTCNTLNTHQFGVSNFFETSILNYILCVILTFSSHPLRLALFFQTKTIFDYKLLAWYKVIMASAPFLSFWWWIEKRRKKSEREKEGERWVNLLQTSKCALLRFRVIECGWKKKLTQTVEKWNKTNVKLNSMWISWSSSSHLCTTISAIFFA